MAVSAEMPRLQPCPSVSVPTPRKGFAAPGCRPPLTRFQSNTFRARFFGCARFPRLLTAIDTKFALWNDNDYQGVENFNLQIADNPGFVGAVSLGSFIASYGPLPTDYSQPVPVQEFDLTDATGRYVRINFLDDHFNSGVINVGEVIFGVGESSAVPEPSALLLMCAGIAGLRLNSRRGKSTNKTAA